MKRIPWYIKYWYEYVYYPNGKEKIRKEYKRF